MNLDEVPAMRAFFFFLFKIWRVLAGNSTKVSAAHRGSEPGVAVFVERMCFWVSFRKRCRRKRTGRRRELLCWCSGRFSRKSVCRPGAPGSLGVRPAPSTPLPRLITWRAKQPAGGCVNARYLRGRLALRHAERPALSVRQRQAGSRPGSFAFWRRCVEEGLVRNWRFLPVLCPSSLSLSFWTKLTDVLILLLLLLFLMSLKICLFHFTLWPRHETHISVSSHRR